ncbi:MAG: hypothetical protein OES38_05330 [Gammaproteobacteria bacterium]|nr:hypothetical protein [Gammaproteobacteria bacterium]
MKNVTVTLDEEVARWVRIHAAEQNTSVSKLLGAMLKERMERESGYQSARLRFMSRRPQKLRKSDGKLPSRDELHERNGLR